MGLRLQLYEFICRGLNVSSRQLDRRERLSHLLPDRLSVVEARAAEQGVIDIPRAADSFGAGDGGGERLDPAGVVLPSAIRLGPAGTGEQKVGLGRQIAGEDILQD